MTDFSQEIDPSRVLQALAFTLLLRFGVCLFEHLAIACSHILHRHLRGIGLNLGDTHMRNVQSRHCLRPTNWLALLALGLWMPASMVMGQQVETATPCDEGTIAEPVELVYGNTTTGCAIDPTSDTDRFFFSGNGQDQVRVHLVVQTTNLDPIVELRDASNTLIESGSCGSTSNTVCAVAFDAVLPATGDYLIIVFENGSDNAGDYLLALERLFPSDAAALLPYDEAVGDTLSPGPDIDFYYFDANADTQLYLSFLTFTVALDPRIEIRDPNGVLVVDGTADGAACNSTSNTRCSFRIAFEPAVTGRYSLLVYDNDGFESGDFGLSLWCVFGDCGPAVTPDSDGPVLLYVPTTPDVVEPAADGDIRTFNATAGTSLRLRLNTQSVNLDPRVEIRDPSGARVVNGAADGAACNSTSNTFCWLQVDLTPAMTGTYTVLVYDDDAFNTGAYEMSLWCLLGECDGDADLLVDGDREVLSYGNSIEDNLIDSIGDADYYEFMGTDGDEIRITVVGQTLNLDPRIEIRDPSGAMVTDGVGTTACNSTSNTTCALAFTIMPGMTGVYSLAIYDDDSFNTGDYDVTLECLFGTGPGFTCIDLMPPPFLCADNCSSVPNPDQRDTNEDGAGNLCDVDLNDDLAVNALDLGIFRQRFFTADPEADFNGDGVVNFVDLGLLRLRFFLPPGPSCSYPNLP